MIKKITTIIFFGLILVGCFNKKTSCTINGLVINDSIKGIDRAKIIETIGTSNLSALEVKGFEDYIYEFNGKKYGISLHYELINIELTHYLKLKRHASPSQILDLDKTNHQRPVLTSEPLQA